MDRLNTGNTVTLCGAVAAPPVFSHAIKDRHFYTFPLTVERLSGTEDKINIICPQELLWTEIPENCTSLMVTGELRSHNNKTGIGNRLQIFVFAEELEFGNEEHSNRVCLTGALCKEPKPRVTPLGREICDLLLAVNRPMGRSDYLPCICWGKNARTAAGLSVGSCIHLDGRIQSRDYIKVLDGAQVTKTAFEISAMTLEVLDGDDCADC